MDANDIDITVAGWVGSDPRHYPGQDGQVPFTQVRVARTRRSYDRAHDTYVDAGTDWFTVKVFRDAATNVAESLRRGDPVVVHGHLRLDEWIAADGQERTTATLVATAIGHNLALGTTRFVRTVRGGATGGGTRPDQTGGGEPGIGEALPTDPLDGVEDGPGDVPVDLSGALLLDDEPEEGIAAVA
jgi:single-strand DNA-binding protein